MTLGTFTSRILEKEFLKFACRKYDGVERLHADEVTLQILKLLLKVKCQELFTVLL